MTALIDQAAPTSVVYAYALKTPAPRDSTRAWGLLPSSVRTLRHILYFDGELVSGKRQLMVACSSRLP